MVFALNIFTAGKTQYAGESTFANFGADFLAGLGDAGDQTSECRIGRTVHAFGVITDFTGEIFLKRKRSHFGGILLYQRGFFSAFSIISATLGESSDFLA